MTRGGKGVYIWDGEVCWVEEGETGREEARGGMMEGIGIPSCELQTQAGPSFIRA